MYTAVIVEDETWSLLNIKTTFPWADYDFSEPVGFTDPKEAIDYVIRSKPDLLLTDMQMPNINGVELIRQIRIKNTDIKIAVISGYAEFSFAQQAIDYGIFSYLLKPITRQDAEKLMIRIKSELDNQKHPDDINKKYSYISNPALKNMLKYINEHFNEKLQLNRLAEQFYLNESYASQLFNETLGVSFTEYLNELKMQKAVGMLKSDISIKELAAFLNYDYTYFNKLFKKRFGMTPKQYRSKDEDK